MAAESQSVRLRELEVDYGRGLASLSDEELLTLLLCPAGRPSKRMATIAQRILETYGLTGLARALTTPVGLTHCGLSLREVTRLKAAHEFLVRLQLRTRMTKAYITNASDVASIVQPELMHLDHEEVHVLVLDAKYQVVEYTRPYRGTVNCTSVREVELFRPALLRNCPAIVVCHNHPSGDADPSPEDKSFTRSLVQVGQVLDIDLLDHVIIGNPGYVSLREVLQWS